MDSTDELKVIAADRMEGSVILTFSNGRCGIYSCQLLYSMLAAAHELGDADDIDLPDDTATGTDRPPGDTAAG